MAEEKEKKKLRGYEEQHKEKEERSRKEEVWFPLKKQKCHFNNKIAKKIVTLSIKSVSVMHYTRLLTNMTHYNTL